MRCSLFFLFALTTTLATSLSLPSIYQSRGHVPFPGPIPYPGRADAPFQDSIDTYKKSYGGLNIKNKIQQANLTDCLTAYGSDEHYDSWAGMECGGFGWFKGPENDTKIGTYDCYATCAWYVRYEGIERGQKAFQCDFRKGMKGHCWMGYQPLSDSTA
ncbi:MAG: hypothetical protein L6R37_002912 [Teloschistes peruensis]|nr:MAG: hypothetical protein L6R37_002912 [Teloschistes peruensis]